MAVIARDAFARDHLVYAWPLPIGPECEVSCGDDEQVVMCPAWMVGDRLGPGRHHWRTPDPMRPVGAFFVSTHPVSATFDMSTAFMIPNTGQPVRIRATGALQVRCVDAGLLIAQFVGLPFDAVNEGILRSVSRSIERMLARLLTRRVVMAATPAAITDPAMLPNIVEELVAYNPTAGAVFGIELIAVAHLVIGADDGSTPFVMLPNMAADVPIDGTWREPSDVPHTNGQSPQLSQPEMSMTETAPGRPKSPTMQGHTTATEVRAGDVRAGEIRAGEIRGSETRAGEIRSGEIRGGEIRAGEIRSSETRSGEIPSKKTERHGSVPPVDIRDSASNQALSGEILVRPKGRVPEPPTAHALGTQPPIEHPRSPDEITQPGVGTPVPGTLKAPDVTPPITPSTSVTPPVTPPVTPQEPAVFKGRSTAPSIPPPIPVVARRATPGTMQAPPKDGASSTSSTSSVTSTLPPSSTLTPPATLPPLAPAHTPMATPPPPVSSSTPASEARGSIMGIGMTAIGSTSTGSVAGEIPTKVPPGGRVLVPGPNGLMQSATVRQLLQGYYELEVGSSGETIWVPIHNVVPE